MSNNCIFKLKNKENYYFCLIYNKTSKISNLFVTDLLLQHFWRKVNSWSLHSGDRKRAPRKQNAPQCASSAETVQFFRGIQKSFPRTTTTNKPFLRPRERSLAVKNYIFPITDLPRGLGLNFFCLVVIVVVIGKLFWIPRKKWTFTALLTGIGSVSTKIVEFNACLRNSWNSVCALNC